VRAHGGTIFLDELGSVPEAVQARLLRVLEERKVKPVGSDTERAVDVRVIAASRHDLETRIAEGVFRSDLYYRLSVVRVTLPPLRARREDIAMIIAELMRRRGLEPGDVHGPNLDVLYARDWPGNVRELRNLVDRAIALSPGATSFADLRLAPRSGPSDEPPASAGIRADLPYADAKQAVLHDFERRYLRDVLVRCEGNISATSRATGLDRKHLRTLLRRHGLIES
jgi:DNA-binding NtrC family response regulator